MINNCIRRGVSENYSMGKHLSEVNDKLPDIMNHSEIIDLIDEIKGYEVDFKDVSVDNVELEQVENIIEIAHQEKEIVKNKSFFSNFFNKEKKVASTKPTIIKFRVDTEGKLINTDIRKFKSISDNKLFLLFNKLFSKIKRNKKNDKKGSSKKSKLGNIKNLGSKIGKLKKVIPNKNNDQEVEGEASTE